MSWLYSRALVVAYSAATCSDGVPSAPSSTNPTPQAYLSPDRMTAFSSLSRFGMTCEPLTESLGAELLTWYLAAFHVRTYPVQERAQGLTVNDQDYGAKWPGLLARYDRDSRSWKTAQYSLLGGLVEFSETWPRWGTMRSGVCWERQTLALPTSGTEFGYSLPTPNTLDSSGTGRMNKNANVKKWGGINSLGGMAATGMWPTPNVPNGGRSCAYVTDWRGSTAYHNGKKVQVGLEHAVKYWPSPRANDAEKRGSIDPANPRNGLPGADNLRTQIGGQLNPTWVEWLMGWPLGWTDSKLSVTDKYQQWQQQHSNYFTTDCVALTNAGR